MDRSAARVQPTAAVPTGTVTFLFCDVEGATARWDDDPAAMRAALGQHDAAVRDVLLAHRGYLFKALGEAFCCAFTLPEDAASAALALQGDDRVNGNMPLRIALHTGSADERDGDYFGPTLNRCARLLAIAHSGQILTSRVTRDLVRDVLAARAVVTDLGTHRLRDLSEPEHVFALSRPDGRLDFPPLRSLSTLPNNLPVARTSFVGREREVAAIETLLAAHRLVTLCGSGGVGKTRTSLHVAAAALERYRDGVWLVELAPLAEPALIAPTVAAALGITLAPASDPQTALVAALRSQQLLLIFDNCEHLIDAAAALIAAILRGAPGVSVLASSRESLKIGGEATYRMPTLAVPPENAVLDAAAARTFGAVALFVERAVAADRRFTLGDENAPVVADIVRRLDGIALAIELAAARIKILDVRRLRTKITERLRLLTGGSRDAFPRQQTLRALIDWSYDLLDARERELFVRVAVFVDGFTYDAAVGVCASDELDEFELLDLLTSLVDKSLIAAEPDGDAMRYRLLESTREYAHEKLAAGADAAAMSRRHAAWIASAASEWYRAYWTTPTRTWLPPVVREVDNIRAAVAWELGADGDPVRAAAIVGHLQGLWYHGGLTGEGQRCIDAARSRDLSAADDATRAALWLARARLSFAKGMVDAANAAREAYVLAGDVFGQANAEQMAAIGFRRMGQLEAAEAAIRRALVLYAAAGAEASWPYVKALDVLAGIMRFAGRTAEARELRSDAMRRFDALGDDCGAAGVRVNLADLEAIDGDPHRAIALAEDAAATYREAGERAGEAIARINVAAFRLLIDDIDGAERSAREGLTLAVRAGWLQGIAIAVQHVATVFGARGEAERAAPLVGYTDAWYRSESFAREPTEQRCYERAMAFIRARLRDEQIEPLLIAGAHLSGDDAVREALGHGFERG